MVKSTLIKYPVNYYMVFTKLYKAILTSQGPTCSISTDKQVAIKLFMMHSLR